MFKEVLQSYQEILINAIIQLSQRIKFEKQNP